MKKVENLTQKGTTANFGENNVELNLEVMDVGKGDSEHYCDIYKEIAELVGEPTTIKIWKHFAGLSIDFPQRLYSKEYIKQTVIDNMDVMKPRDIARKVNLSERRVRQIMKEYKEEK